MSARAAVLSRLSFKVGFPFSESELSPSLRRKIGELEALKVQIDSTVNAISMRQTELVRIQATKDNLSTMLFGRRQLKVRIEEMNREISTLKSSVDQIYSALNSKVDTLSSEIFSVLSTSHEGRAKVAVTGPSMQMVKETVREVVMIPCAYCRGVDAPDLSQLSELRRSA